MGNPGPRLSRRSSEQDGGGREELSGKKKGALQDGGVARSRHGERNRQKSDPVRAGSLATTSVAAVRAGPDRRVLPGEQVFQVDRVARAKSAGANALHLPAVETRPCRAQGCAGALRKRTGRNGVFWACSRYPDCTATEAAPPVPLSQEHLTPSRGGGAGALPISVGWVGSR